MPPPIATQQSAPTRGRLLPRSPRRLDRHVHHRMWEDAGRAIAEERRDALAGFTLLRRGQHEGAHGT